MRRLTRYVIAEFLQIFAVTLIFMTTLMIFGLVLVEGIREGLAPVSVLRLLPYSIPMALLYAIPGTTLFAVCAIYGRMSAANEITAVKAAGVPPLVMIRPILVLTILLSLVVVWLNDVAVSWGRLGWSRVVLESVEQIVYSMLRSHKAFSMPRFSINVRGVEGQRLLQPTITLRLNDDGPPMVCMAEEAELHCDPVAETLRLVLRDCEIDWGKYHGNFPDTVERVIPLADATKRGNEAGKPANTPLGRIPQEIRDQNHRITHLEQVFAAEAALQMMTGDLDGLTGDEWNSRHGQMTAGTARLHRLRTEPWRRVANGFSCFFFALVGAPLAVRLKTPDVWTSFGICFLPILIAYYPLMMYGADLAKSGELPPYIVWLGNGALALAGYLLIRRMQRY